MAARRLSPSITAAAGGGRSLLAADAVEPRASFVRPGKAFGLDLCSRKMDSAQRSRRLGGCFFLFLRPRRAQNRGSLPASAPVADCSNAAQAAMSLARPRAMD